jgi:uncharacterized membrane protein YdjX (TVP38/TMEM64 family)
VTCPTIPLKSKMKKVNPGTALKIIAILIVISALFYFYNHYEIRSLVTRENMEIYLRPFGMWIPVVWVAIFIVGSMFYAPASVLLVTIGTLLGPVWGSLWGITGCYLASLVMFFTARKLRLDSVRTRLGKNWEKFNSKIEADGFFYVAMLRATLVLPFGVICYGSAITSIKVKDYIKGTLIGCYTQTIIFCYIVPMVISNSLSAKNIVILSITTILWLAVFGLVYIQHKRKNINPVSVLES